jgi:hypothetical protein
VKRLITRYYDIIPNFEESLTTKLREYCDLKLVIAEIFKTGSIQTFIELWNCALKDDQFQEVSILMDICGTFQSDRERGFSPMNLIKYKSRNGWKCIAWIT